MRDIRPIHDDDDLAWAIGEVSVYFEHPPEPGSDEADRFDVLSDLIEAHENKHHPVSAPDARSLIIAFMEMTGRTQADLALLFESRPRASEVLSGKRALSMEMVRRLTREWGLPAEALIRQSTPEAA
ncbi:type II toxin-antitoxin system HigA family antitoxin [soil metagenome]